MGWDWPPTVEPGRRAIKVGVTASMPQDAAQGSGIGVWESGELPILNPEPLSFLRVPPRRIFAFVRVAVEESQWNRDHARAGLSPQRPGLRFAQPQPPRGRHRCSGFGVRKSGEYTILNPEPFLFSAALRRESSRIFTQNGRLSESAAPGPAKSINEVAETLLILFSSPSFWLPPTGPRPTLPPPSYRRSAVLLQV